jgi:N6-L-threonylcarbamoyladenine synthase
MKVLGIETSCDETAAAVVEDGTKLVSSVIASQMDIHAEYGGIVPEVAARSHIEVMLPVITKALRQASTSWDDIDAIAVGKGPGLIGSLLIGTLTATTLAALKHKPLIAVNHVEAHVYANFLISPLPSFPLLALIVSGGHTQLVLFQNHGRYEVLGRTRDDAAGEAFDKVARLLGLSSPRGQEVPLAAVQGDPRVFALPKPQLGKSNLDFSFSGLKTAVLRAAQTAAGRDFRTPSHQVASLLSNTQRNDLAASFQYVAVETLVDKVMQAYERYRPSSVVVVGGVAANLALRERLAERLPIAIPYPPIQLCTDNAAMIASAGYFYQRAGRQTPNSTGLVPDPILSM